MNYVLRVGIALVVCFLTLPVVGCGSGDGGGGSDLGACALLDGTVVTTNGGTCAAFQGTFFPGQAAGSVTPTAPNKSSIGAFAQAMELLLRENHDIYLKTVGVLGRDFWNLNGVDPEWTGALMGKNGAQLSDQSQLLTIPFLKHYRIVQLGAILLRAVNAATDLTMEEERGVRGYAKTLQAYALLLVLSRQWSNGVLPTTSLEFPQAANILDVNGSLTHISDLLNDGSVDLTNGGPDFIFLLTPGFAGFNTPATFRQFNRALYARTRLYAGDKAGALTGIAASFFNINGPLDDGPRLFYDTAANNGMYFQPGVDLYIAHPDFVADAEVGDLSVSNKAAAPMTAVAHDLLTGNRQVRLYPNPLDALPLIRNEELILIYAEAQIGSDVNEVLAGINRSRNLNGLGNYLGATDDASLLNAVIARRRYSLFGEGHRWVDTRRTGKLGTLNIDRVGDVVHMNLPRPAQSILNQIALP